jgi:tungstate transport system permease protein
MPSDPSGLVAELWPIAKLSVGVSISAVAISGAIGIPLGVWMGTSGLGRNPWLRGFLNTGMALPPVAVGLLLYLMLARSGPLHFLGWLYTPSAMILAQIILSLPFVIGITNASMVNQTEELNLRLVALGASFWQRIYYLIVETRKSILVAMAVALGRCFSEVGAVMMLGGNIEGHTRVVTTAIVLQTGRGQFGLALAMAALLLSIALIVNLLVTRLSGGEPKW